MCIRDRNDVPPSYTLCGQLACLMSAYRAECVKSADLTDEAAKLRVDLAESRTHVGELEAALQTSRELCDSLRGNLNEYLK